MAKSQECFEWRDSLYSEEDLLGQPVGIGMGVNNDADLRRITTTHTTLHGNARVMAGLQNKTIAFATTFYTAGKPSEFIGFQDIYPAEVKYEIRLYLLNKFWQGIFQNLKVFFVSGAIGNFEIKI